MSGDEKVLKKSRPNQGINMKKKDSLQNGLRRLYERFVKIRGRPREIALGFALGLFIGMTPTMGIQMPIAVFIAAIFKWSKISAAFGVWITNPFTAPFVYGLTYIVGAKLLNLKAALTLPNDFSWDLLKELISNAPLILSALTVGGIIVGLPLAVAGYFLSYGAINQYQQKVKQKLAARKALVVHTKEKIKKKIHPKRMDKK
jgi:uncharacterized protein (DUF2062 family)